MVDVSAQAQCTITLIRPNTLNNTGGALSSGSTDVRFHCKCVEDGGGDIQTRWFDPTQTRLNTLANTNPGIPYFILNGSNTEATLVIPTFSSTYAGTYTCGRNLASNPADTPPTATITLNICKLIILIISYFNLVLYSLKYCIHCDSVEFVLKYVLHGTHWNNII